MFEGLEDYLVIIGSNNFTESGLVKNIECSVIITHHKSNPEDRSILEEIEQHFSNLFLEQDDNLKPLTNDLILLLEQTGLAPSEQIRSRRYDRKTDNDNDNVNANRNPFSSTRIQYNPIDFSPKRIIRKRQPPRNEAEQRENMSDTNNWIGESYNDILIAEIGKSPRWKQVDFSLPIFQDFFGATAGDNTYIIKLRYLDENGELHEIENRPAVTTASSNYRFEIGAAKGSYPSEGKPIGVFIKVAPLNFIYRLYMPNSTDYSELKTYLENNFSGRSRSIKRIVKPYDQISNDLEFLQF